MQLGCGQSRSGNPIVVGDQQLPRATVAGFAVALERGSTFPWLSPELSTPTRQASALLIRYRWLIGEGADEGVAVSSGAATRALQAKAATSLGGKETFQATLRQTGETEAQAQLVVAAEISAQRLLRRILRSVPRPSRGEVVGYYRSHRARFSVAEERFFDIAERIDGPVELASAKRTLVEEHSVRGVSYEAEFHESLSRDLIPKLQGDRGAFVRAIFSTRPGVVSGPYKYFGQKAIFKMDRIVPGYVRPLSAVRGQIATRLHDEAIARARAKFVKAWRSKWTARTECTAGYVVPGCKEFHGPLAAEEQDPLSPE
jgi:hypothetical protein